MTPKSALRGTLHLVLACALLATALALPASAAPGSGFSVEPLTWDVVGLDSNSPATGPDVFPVGARFCNTDTVDATNVQTTFEFGPGASSKFTLANGVSATTGFGTVEPDACVDSYYLVKVASTAPSEDTAPYTIVATSDQGASQSTPAGRQLYVEMLVSQNRNAITSISGPSTVYTGQQYTYVLDAKTATNGYEQLETYLTLSNTIFRIVDADVTYSAPSGATNDRVYADACGWDPDPTSANYLSCVGPANYESGKAGGNVRLTYTVEVLGTGTNDITAMIYDFSGSSYHYNSDYGGTVLSIESFPSTDLSVDIANDGPFHSQTNDSYTVTVANEGELDTDGTLTATVDLTPGVQFTAATGTDWSCSAAGDPNTSPGQTVTCTRSTPLPAGTSSDITLDVYANVVSAASLTADAEIATDAATNDTNAANNTDTVNHTAVNRPPVADDDTDTTEQDAPVTVDVRSNDTDLDGDTLTVTGVGTPANGTAVVTGSGEVRYSPNLGFSGSDTFSYTVSDGNGSSDSATVTVTVQPAPDSQPDPDPDAPEATNPKPVTPEPKTPEPTTSEPKIPPPSSPDPAAENDNLSAPVGMTQATLDLLGNDNADGGTWDPTTLTVSNVPDGLDVQVLADGSVRITAEKAGTYRFDYEVCTTDSDCRTAEVTVDFAGLAAAGADTADTLALALGMLALGTLLLASIRRRRRT